MCRSQSLYHMPSYTSSRSLELDLSFLQYDGTKQTPVPFIPHMAPICSFKVVSSFIRMPANACFLGWDPDGRDEVKWWVVWATTRFLGSVEMQDRDETSSF
ncbi:hypothetical protein V8E51_019006 [Hyaloscypha variabilis]